jgi:parallel beta-helix repeat protein
MSNYNSFPALIDVTISGNSSVDHGGGVSNYNSSPVLTNVTISGNSAVQNGGGMYNVNTSKPVLTNVTISGNSATNGGGMYNANNSAPVLVNITISGNIVSTDGGGIYNHYSSPVLVNVLISGNKADSGGGGIKNGYSSPSLTNVTISGNLTINHRGSIYNDHSSPHIKNSIIWGNMSVVNLEHSGIYNDGSGSTPVIAYSIVQESDGSGGWEVAIGTDGGNNLVDTNPQFAGPVLASSSPTAGGNYRLQSGPAVNAGSDTLYPDAVAIGTQIGAMFSAELEAAINTALAKDLGGANRKNGTIDMGAYEKN